SSPLSFAVLRIEAKIAQLSAPPSLPLNNEFFLPSAIGRIERSTVLVSTSTRPSVRNTVRPSQWPSVYLIASARGNLAEMSLSTSVYGARDGRFPASRPPRCLHRGAEGT